MARLAAAALSSGVDTAVYTVPSNRRASFTLALCNRGTTDAQIRVALTTGGAPSNPDYIEYDVTLRGNSALERSGLILTAAQVCYVRASTANVSAVVYGIEEQV